jgi:DNA-binding transcriptional LysR family regulator
MDKLRAMQTVIAIAEKGSLTAAAESLGASLPSVVRQLATYEQELGVRLFNRTTRRVSLTQEGQQHVLHCRHVLDTVAEGEAALSATSVITAGDISLTAPVLFGQLFVAPAVARFAALHPGVRCRVVLLDRIVDLVEEGLDVGIRIGELPDSSFVAWPAGRVRRVVVGSPAYLRKHGTPQHPKDLGRFNCIRISGGDPVFGDFQEGGKRFRVPVTGNLEFNLVAPAVTACADGAGLGMFFSYQVAALLEAKRLKIVLEDFELPARPISVVVPQARMLPARTRAFIDFVRSELAQLGSAALGPRHSGQGQRLRQM